MMHWKKLGQLYHFEPNGEYIYSHATNPVAINIYEDVFKIYFSSRDAHNKSSLACIEVDIVKQEVLENKPVLLCKYGHENSFYSHGISIGNMYQINEQSFILFMGWQFPKNDHWRGDIGRLKQLKTGGFVVDPQVPFIGMDKEDTVSLSYPWVIFDKGLYKMWYGSTISWTSENEEMVHVIKYATSTDGENWTKHGIAIPYKMGLAQAFSRPTVLIEKDEYHMWYSYRSGDGTPYRIGYAFSKDGLNWNRQDNNSGINVSSEGWDSQMICYPYVFKHKNNTYMLYNGNEYGKYGFGLALLEK